MAEYASRHLVKQNRPGGRLSTMEKSKLIILDRDGVINHDSDQFIKSPEEWSAIPGSLEAIARLCREDYRVVVITNQSGIARGYFSINALNRIHQKMLDELNHAGGEISSIFFCPHAEQDNCECRKPKPGMFHELSGRLQYKLDNVYAVGDSLRDLQAADAAGAKPVLVLTGKGRRTAEQLEGNEQSSGVSNAPQFVNLERFVDDLLKVPESPDCTSRK